MIEWYWVALMVLGAIGAGAAFVWLAIISAFASGLNW